MTEFIRKTVEILRRYPNASPEEVKEHLVAIVGDGELAERLIEFVPLAFAHVALADSGIKLQTSFRRLLENREVSHSCPLSAEPLWQPAIELAREEKSKDIPVEDRLALLAYSAEFNAVSKALEDGVKVRGAVMAPVIFLRPAPMPCKRSAWWQFWKRYADA